MSDQKIQQLQDEIDNIKKRNERVEANKSWETSWTRKISIAVLTYIVIVLFFFSADIARPFINAIVPTIGFLLSTLSMDIIRKRWVQKK